MLLTISELALSLGVSVGTLRRWDRAGTLKPQMRTAGGHRRYILSDALRVLTGIQEPQDQAPEKLVIGYARVSSYGQVDDLKRQEERLARHLAGVPSASVITDLGSGLNFKKRGLCMLLGLVLEGRVSRLVVTHKDRLLRFGFELLEKVVQSHGGTIEVLEDVCANEDVELAKDVLTIITVFSAKLYGRRSHEKRQRAA